MKTIDYQSVDERHSSIGRANHEHHRLPSVNGRRTSAQIKKNMNCQSVDGRNPAPLLEALLVDPFDPDFNIDGKQLKTKSC